jgi:hypothetical protein
MLSIVDAMMLQNWTTFTFQITKTQAKQIEEYMNKPEMNLVQLDLIIIYFTICFAC